MLKGVILYFLWVGATTISAAAVAKDTSPSIHIPTLSVPACPKQATVQYDQSVPNRTAFPLTQVDLCYDTQAINLIFTAYNETNFFFNNSYKTNDPIYEYEVMETFIAPGTVDPKTYLEFEIAPNNVTFNAFIYNPTKVRAPGAPFDTFYIQTPVVDGMVANTVLDKSKQKWTSNVRIPLGLFNVDDGQIKGSRWRMNFFRTVVSPGTFPDQLLGAWSVPDAPSFHKTPFFGRVVFV